MPDLPTPVVDTSEAVLDVLRAIADFSGAQRLMGAHLSTELDLPRASVGLLHYLLRSGPVQIGELAHHMRVDLSVASRQVSGLVDAGVAIRSVDPCDRRARTIELTSVGVERAQQVQGSLAALLADAFNEWDPDDLHNAARQMSALTRTIADHIGPTAQPHTKDHA